MQLRSIKELGLTDLDEMFRARRRMFVEKLGWELQVDSQGREMDEYDSEKARYLLLSNAWGGHRSSMRLMLISDECMTVNAFPGLFQRDMIDDPNTSVEVTRFCVDPWEAGAAVELFNEGAEWLYSKPVLTSFVGVFYPAMLRIYKKAGWMPRIVNKRGPLMVGQWSKKDYSPDRST